MLTDHIPAAQLAVLAADTTQPVVERTVGDALRLAADAWGERIALEEGCITPNARRWSFTALLAEAERVARALLQLFKPGEHLAICAANSPEWVLVEFGAALAGLVLVTANPALAAGELTYLLRQSRSSGVLVQPSFRGHDLLALIDKIRPSLPGLREVISLDGLAAIPVDAPDGEKLPIVAAGQLAQIQYTSGTTGLPKGAMLTHRGLTNNARFYAQSIGAGRDDIWINPMPMFHTAGCGLATLGSLQTGGRHVIAQSANAAGLLALVAAKRGTLMLCVPTILIRILDHPDARRHNLSSWRACTLGGAPVSPELVRRAQDELGIRVAIGYGQTEASPYLTHTLLKDPNPAWALTVGRPLPQTELKIMALTSDNVLPRGAVGEILARGYSIMRGYFDDEPATRAALGADGWLRTGDLGSIDAHGYLNIQGRLKDMIIRGGENVFPREVEDVLFTHIGIANAAVLGLPDREWGEIVAAFVELREGYSMTAKQLEAFCGPLLAPFKVPTIWYFVTHLPQTASGKIQKFVLREQAIAGGLAVSVNI